MFSNRILLTVASTLLVLSLCVTNARAQAAPPQFYVVCSSQENLSNVYMSGTLQGPATALQTFSAGFTQFLKQTYSYQGGVSCIPMRTVANVQTFTQSRTTALHNMKKNLVQTGWTEAAPSATGGAPAAGGAPGNAANVLGNLLGAGKSNATAPASSPAKAPAAQQPQGAGQQTAASSAQGGNPAPGAPVIQIFNNLFGPGSSGGSGGSGNASAPSGTSGSASKGSQGQGQAAAAAGKSSAASGTGTSTSSQVTSVLSNLFAKGSGGGASSEGASAGGPGKSASKGGGPGKGAQPQPAAEPQPPVVNALPAGALGMAQYQNTKLTVYGCGRQGTQVLCVTDLTNQNPQETLLKSDSTWKDAFLVDDRGDRHTRTDGYFLNVDGDRRQQLDLDYGKSAHFILAFDAVQTKVEKVTLRSATGGLNVQDIGLIAPGASAAAQ